MVQIRAVIKHGCQQTIRRLVHHQRAETQDCLENIMGPTSHLRPILAFADWHIEYLGHNVPSLVREHAEH